MQTILVTGANGFVGSHILETLQARNDVRVIAACRDAKKLPASFKGEIREGDLRDDVYLDQLVEDVDVVCHAASWTSLWKHKHESKALYFDPSIKLIDKLEHSNVKRFVFVSTVDGNGDKVSICL